jgi:hypothetical protein
MHCAIRKHPSDETGEWLFLLNTMVLTVWNLSEQTFTMLDLIKKISTDVTYVMDTSMFNMGCLLRSRIVSDIPPRCR